MKLTQITLDPRGDGYYILFVDQEKQDEGDDYHTKISHKIEGIKDFLGFINYDFSFEEIVLDTKSDDKELYEYDYQPDVGEKLDDYIKRLKKIGFKIIKK